MFCCHIVHGFTISTAGIEDFLSNGILVAIYFTPVPVFNLIYEVVSLVVVSGVRVESSKLHPAFTQLRGCLRKEAADISADLKYKCLSTDVLILIVV